jgi:probable rRNA maturation factor
VVDVFAADEQSEQAVDIGRWTELARQVLGAQGVREDVEVALLFVDEPTIAELHERFLGEHGPTDVLAFPIDEEPEPGGRSPDEGGTGPGGALPSDEDAVPYLLGDVVICPAVAARNAAAHAATLEDETALLVVHGLLHLLGMDHGEDSEAEQMERREQELLARFHRSDR